MAAGLEIENANRLRKQELMFAIMKRRAKQGEQIFGDGVLEVLPDGFGFLRSPETSYLARTDDIYISPSHIRRFNLPPGDSRSAEHTPELQSLMLISSSVYFFETKIRQLYH